MAAVMNQGLQMSQEEKETRHAKLHSVIMTHTSQTWAMSLVKLLLSVVDSQGFFLFLESAFLKRNKFTKTETRSISSRASS
jgi:trehalose 6-phosphate synthase/phosphatase